MEKFIDTDYKYALQIVTSTIDKCEKMQPKFKEGTSQHSLLRNRIKAMYISKALLLDDGKIDSYTTDDLKSALAPVQSIISKCRSGQKKHDETAAQYKRFQKIIDAMTLAQDLITKEITKRQ